MNEIRFQPLSQPNLFPGHMLKASRQIKEKLKLVDLALLLVDSRIPESSINNELENILGVKPKMIVMNKSDLSDNDTTRAWAKSFKDKETPCVFTNVLKKKGLNQILPTVRETIKNDRKKRGATRPLLRPYRLLIMGVPNVGKIIFNQCFSR